MFMKIKLVKRRNYPELKQLYDNFDVSSKGEICVAVGGDGTFVNAAEGFDGPILPVRGGDENSVGYYADLGIEDIRFIIKNLRSRNYSIEKMGNKLELLFKGRKHYAVNEIVLHNVKEEVSFKIFEVEGKKRQELYPYVMSGDGILITGAIGSTAYNKSAGGPIILTPGVICITFLNVDGPYKNPIVTDSTKNLEIEVTKYRGILRCDGTDCGTMKPGDKFTVRISKKELKIVRFKGMREELATKLDRIIRSRMLK